MRSAVAGESWMKDLVNIFDLLGYLAHGRLNILNALSNYELKD